MLRCCPAWTTLPAPPHLNWRPRVPLSRPLRLLSDLPSWARVCSPRLRTGSVQSKMIAVRRSLACTLKGILKANVRTREANGRTRHITGPPTYRNQQLANRFSRTSQTPERYRAVNERTGAPLGATYVIRGFDAAALAARGF